MSFSHLVLSVGLAFWLWLQNQSAFWGLGSAGEEKIKPLYQALNCVGCAYACHTLSSACSFIHQVVCPPKVA